MRIRDIVKLMRHAGCGGRASKVELISGIEGAVAGRCGRSSSSTAEER
jgi:hypothetical protein